MPPTADAVNIEGLIHRYRLEPNDRGVNLNPPCSLFYDGSSFGQDLLSFHVPLGFELHDQWSDGQFRAVWVNREARAIFTYCEGDLNLTIDTTEEVFAARLLSAAEYYKEH